MGYLVLVVLIAAVAFFLLDPSGHVFADLQNGQTLMMVFYGVFALVLLASIMPRYRGRLPHILRDAALWVCLFGFFLAVYAYRDTFSPFTTRLMAELDPGTVTTPAPGEAAVVRRSDGTFVIDMVADGVRLPFVFDTGASTVVLRARDAQKIGIDPKHLAFTEEVSTANGRTRAAEADIESLSVGSITLNNVQALVAEPGALNENLLGQTFLERLASYGVEGDRLVLRSK
jgi:aspartyl protease family protein